MSGEVFCPEVSHSSMASRSYVKPSEVETGSAISSEVMGQTNESGILSIARVVAGGSKDGGRVVRAGKGKASGFRGMPDRPVGGFRSLNAGSPKQGTWVLDFFRWDSLPV